MIPYKKSTCNTRENYDPRKELAGYEFPSIDLLDDPSPEFSSEYIIETRSQIIETFRENGTEIISIDIAAGYTNTLYEVVPQKGFRIARIKQLQAELSFVLKTHNVSISPIFEKGAIGIIVPNKNPAILPIKSIIDSDEFVNSTPRFELPMIIGRTLTHDNVIIDLTERRHILVSGATGQGKSVLLSTMITSLLYKKHPSELKLVLVDPGGLELNMFSGLRNHFLATYPDSDSVIVTDATEANMIFQSLTVEMKDRFRLLQNAHVRTLKEYNSKFRERKLNPSVGHYFMPYLVVIVDRFSDLEGSMDEKYLKEIVEMGHTVGIHLIVSMQRPSHDILPSNIKSNILTRVAFRTTSREESRMILDKERAERLAGNGDAIYKDEFREIRLQVPYISTNELIKVVTCIRSQQGYNGFYLLPENVLSPLVGVIDLDGRDALFEEAARLIVIHQQGSTSLIQRKLGIGYNRAGMIMDQLEAAGIVGLTQGAKSRDVFIADEYSLEKLLRNL